jgi:hypothetical protein
MALAPNFTTSAFPIPNYFNLKNFLLEVVAIGRKNAGKDPDTPPLSIATTSHTVAFFFVPFCIVMPIHGEGEGVGGEFLLGGKGGIESMK